MILLYTNEKDQTSLLLQWELEKRNAPFLRVHPSDFPTKLKVSNHYNALGHYEVEFEHPDYRFSGSDVSAIFFRRPDRPVPHSNVQSEAMKQWIELESSKYLLETLELLDCYWFPARPAVIYYREERKLAELNAAAHVGFQISPTIVTNDPQRVLQFYQEQDGHIIHKRYNSSNIPVDDTQTVYFPTSIVSLRDISYVHQVKFAPTLFQAYVPKSLELRVTVVGEHVVAAEIHSQVSHRTRHDWRNYDWQRTPYRLHTLPEQEKQQCIRLVQLLGLQYGTIDLALTPGGEYMFFEINPAGQFSWIQCALNINIASLICEQLLDNGTQMKTQKPDQRLIHHPIGSTFPLSASSSINKNPQP